MIKHLRTDLGEAGSALARFTVEIGEVQLRNVLLVRNDDGGYKVLPPRVFNKSAYVVRPRAWAQIQREAIDLYEARSSVAGRTDHAGSVAIDLG